MLKRYFYIIRFPIVATVLTVLVFQFVSFGSLSIFLYNLVRVGVIFWAGWLVIHAEWGTIPLSAPAGPALALLDHVLVGGVFGMLSADLSKMPAEILEGSPLENPRTAYFAGILISYVMFLPAAACISAAAGFIGRRFSARVTT